MTLAHHSLPSRIRAISYIFRRNSRSLALEYFSLTNHSNILNRDTASTLWNNGQTQHRQSHRGVLVAGKGCRYHQPTSLTLEVADRAILAVNIGTTAAARKAGCTGFAANFAVEATNSSFPRTSETSTVVQATTIDAA